jgi:hypothetical protein
MRWWYLPIVIALGCGGSSGTGTGEPCTGDETRCVGDSYQVCQGGEFFVSETCGGELFCAVDHGCVACDPNHAVTTCVGNDIHVCSDDGSPGEFVESCGGQSCANGVCTSDCGTAGVDLIYLVDDSYNLYRFDPREIGAGEPFSLIGAINCPAGPPLPARDDGNPATPFSMSVDRFGRAWVLYTSGEIFWVSTSDASCEKSWFVPGTAGFELFGMGFVTNTPGGSEETLFISGGTAAALNTGDLGAVDPVSQVVTRIGPLPNAEFPPEMTGTSEAKLFGYYPGLFESRVSNIEKTSGQDGPESWPVPTVPGGVGAWAFAHWGGEFYIFQTTQEFIGGLTENVLHLDPVSGNVQTVLMDTNRNIVGAGVSTCAPIVPEG